jgi:hypothetical protein
MSENEAIVNSLEEKIRVLVELHKKLLNENHGLIVEKDELLETIRLKDIQLAEAQSRFDQLKLAKLLVTKSEDVHETKLKVNKIVREIDKCIALLNK